MARRDNESRLEELEAKLGVSHSAPSYVDWHRVIEGIRGRARWNAAIDALPPAEKITALRAHLAEMRANPPEPPEPGVLSLFDPRWHPSACRRIEIDIAELEGVSAHQIWVARELLGEFICGKNKRLPPNPIPTHEEAMEVIESGNIHYATMPKALEGWRLEQHGKHWVLVNPKTRARELAEEQALLEPRSHPMLEERDRFAGYRERREALIEPKVV
jgi:hypothetical protein